MPTKSEIWVWFDGRIGTPDEARVSVLDHGFLYGDSVYETLRTHGRAILAADAHLDRLEASAAAIGLELPLDRVGILDAMKAAAAAAPEGREAGLRVMVTRGVGPLGLDPALCTEPRLFILGWPVRPGRHPRYTEGFRIIVSTVRRNPVGALDPRIKSGNFLNNILAFREARAADADEAILLTMDGHVAEATTSNVFWIRGGTVRTPPVEGILPGITRSEILRILAEHEVPVEIGSFPPEDLREADEVFITSTLKGVMPVVAVDDRSVAGGTPGPLTAEIADWYENRVES